MKGLEIGIEIIFSFLESATILLVYMVSNQDRSFIFQNKYKTITFSILYMLFSFWATTFLPSGLHTIIISVFIIISFPSVAPINIYGATVLLAIFAVFTGLVEGVILIFEMMLFNINLEMILDNLQVKLIHYTVCTVTKYTILFILLHYRVKIFKSDIFKKKNLMVSSILLQTFMITVFIFSTNYMISQGMNTNINLYNLLLLSIYLLIIILSVHDWKEREKALEIKKQFELQEEHVKKMESIMDIIRREKHDFNNHLNTIFAICVLKKEGSLRRIEEYIRKLTDNLNSSYKFYHTGNDYIDGLLAVKSNFAFEHDIDFDVNFEAPLSLIDVNDSDLTSTIANIVDNAFEAVLGEQCYADKMVSIFTYTEDQQYCIAISDNGPQILPEHIDKVFYNGFSTKENDKKDHGYGLYITKKMIQRNNGEIKVISTESETKFLIKFRIKEIKYGETSSSDH